MISSLRFAHIFRQRCHPLRHVSSTSTRTGTRIGLSLILASGATVLAVRRSTFHASIHADFDQESMSPDIIPDPDLKNIPFNALLRSYFVYAMCSVPVLVDHSPRLLQLANLPGIRLIAETFVRVTFFDQFVGGETAQETISLLRKFRGENKGVLLGYSVEADQTPNTSVRSDRSAHDISPHKRAVEEVIHSIDVAADFEDEVNKWRTKGRKTWVAVKFSALLPDSDALLKLSRYIVCTQPVRFNGALIPFPGCPQTGDLDVLYKPTSQSITTNTPGRDFVLTPKEIVELKELYDDLKRICVRARDRGVRVVVDAEYSWYQPAIDALALVLTKEFNKLVPSDKTDGINTQPLVYGTYQAYLRRTPSYLTQALLDAHAGGYALGVKLVRGAYHPHELAAHTARGRQCIASAEDLASGPPVWQDKAETDAAYDWCVRVLLGEVKADMERNDIKTKTEGERSVGIGVLFGTHNWGSCVALLKELERIGLAIPVGGADKSGGGVLEIDEDVAERVAVAQLLGMRDDLTRWLVRTVRCASSPVVVKYVPYGTLSEVMPFLSRRAIENKSVLGQWGRGRGLERRLREG